MLHALRLAPVLVALLVAAPAGAMPPDEPDKPACSASFDAVRAAVDAVCDCEAPRHGWYVRCAVRTVKELVADGSLDRRCKGAMTRLFARSTCGKPDAVACCLPGGCAVKKTSVCEQRGGTPGATAFCTDACGSPSGAFIGQE